MKSRYVLFAVLAGALLSPVHAGAQRRGGPPPGGGSPPTAKVMAPIDLTGYWVSVVSEDWRYRMVTPPKGDYQNVPMTPEARRIADAWDPAADQASGNQCKSYGAAAIMRVPGRIHVTWQDDNTLRLDSDAGMQTRIFRFGAASARSAEPTWQGDAVAAWEIPGGGRGRGRGGPPPDGRGGPPPPGGRGGPPPADAPKFGSLKVVATNLRPGYLRRNGVPYSDSAVVTEYYDVANLRNGDQVLVVTTIVDDSRYLQQPFMVSTQFKKQADAAGWEPTPCSSTW